MAVKTPFSHADFVTILAQYDLGTFQDSAPIESGTVQTNMLVWTTRGKFVFRYYENRSFESVAFEIDVLTYLATHNYPCPRPYKDLNGSYVGVYNQKPYVLFAFIEGRHADYMNERHRSQIIQKAAELHTLTCAYRPPFIDQRWNYSVDVCRKLAYTAAIQLDTSAAYEKYTWLDQQLSMLRLPDSLPKGICHCDVHVSNILFNDDQFAVLLDFDDANYTYLMFDLVGLIEAWAWPYQSNTLDLQRARSVVREYMNYRSLNALEQQHLYDVYQLSICMDAVWFFGRGTAEDCYERRKLTFLHDLGSETFTQMIFSMH